MAQFSNSAHINPHQIRLENDRKMKFLESRITLVERNFTLFHEDITGIVRKNGRLREKFDKFVQDVQNYASQENPSIQIGLIGFSDCLAALEDYRQASSNMQYI